MRAQLNAAPVHVLLQGLAVSPRLVAGEALGMWLSKGSTCAQIPPQPLTEDEADRSEVAHEVGSASTSKIPPVL